MFMTMTTSYSSSLDDTDYDTVENIWRFLNSKIKQWLQNVIPYLSYRILTKSPFLFIYIERERGTGQYFYHDIHSDDIPYRMMPSLAQSVNHIPDRPRARNRTDRNLLRFPPCRICTLNTVSCIMGLNIKWFWWSGNDCRQFLLKWN